MCSLYRDVQYSASITNLWLPFWGVFSGKPKKKGGSPKKQKKESVEPDVVCKRLQMSFANVVNFANEFKTF